MKTFLLSAVAGVLLAGGVTGAPPEAPRRPRITGVAHIALAVHDMDKARGYYTDFLGFAEPYHLSNPDGSLSMTFIKINDRQYIELFPEKAAGTDRLLHFSIETDDAEAMRVYLRANGIRFPTRQPRAGSGTSPSTSRIRTAIRSRSPNMRRTGRRHGTTAGLPETSGFRRG